MHDYIFKSKKCWEIFLKTVSNVLQESLTQALDLAI